MPPSPPPAGAGRLVAARPAAPAGFCGAGQQPPAGGGGAGLCCGAGGRPCCLLRLEPCCVGCCSPAQPNPPLWASHLTLLRQPSSNSAPSLPHPKPPQGVTCDADVEAVEAVAGAGVTALVEGRRVVAGTAALLASAAGVAGAEVDSALAAIDEDGAWGGDRKCREKMQRGASPPPRSERACCRRLQPASRCVARPNTLFPLLLAGATACFVAVDGRLAGWLRCAVA